MRPKADVGFWKELRYPVRPSAVTKEEAYKAVGDKVIAGV